MKRDAQATRQRILKAATAEFAQHGIAGARIDRIAENADCNKAMIYAYYTNKDQLFEAVFDAMVVRNVNDVPINAHDLPEYAASLFEQYQKYPEVARIATWDRLERGGAGVNIKAVVEANEHKVNEISKAQQEGVLGSHFPASLLLELIFSLTHLRSINSKNHEEEPSKHRQAIKDAVQKLIHE
jgi:AcrR family transcriptional regulator